MTLLLLCLLVIPAQGCIIPSKQSLVEPQFTEDVAVMAEGGLEMPVMGFDWAYYHDGVHIKLAGKVRNNSGQPRQAVSIQVEIFDERGEHLGTAGSFVTPTYLAPGAEGDFEVTIMPLRKRQAKNLRIVTLARVLR